jgi:drug/metabolite transporter (DMT)-like permease
MAATLIIAKYGLYFIFRRDCNNHRLCLYYYVLIHLPATTVGFIPLISPAIALYLGHTINHEPFTIKIAAGTALILTALLMHEFFDRFFGGRARKKSHFSH